MPHSIAMKNSGPANKTGAANKTAAVNDKGLRKNHRLPQPGFGTAVFALIVGIDKYMASDDLPTLGGAVNDALSFRKFLMDSREARGLQVSPSHIKLLTNKQATRAAILSTLTSHFLDNDDIPNHGEATMIFYFAGHGSRVAYKNNRMLPDGMGEAICPVDERTSKADGTHVKGLFSDSDSSTVHPEYVYAIPDYVLGQFLHNLAEKKGNNITVILDSCHSGGMGREASAVSSFRSAKTPSRFIPASLDRDLWKSQNSTAHPYRVWAPTSTSHVLLAACKQMKRAYESSTRPFHGYFSSYLVAALRKADLENTTFTELICGLPRLPNNQVPLCHGSNKHKLLFTTRYPAIGRRLVLTRNFPTRSKNLQPFAVPIGTVEGVCSDTEFNIYAPDNSLICTVVPRPGTLEHHRTIIQLDKTVVQKNRTVNIRADGTVVGLRAAVKNWNNASMVIHVHTHPNFAHTSDLFLSAETRDRRMYKQQQSRELAHIALRSEGHEIIVERLALTTRLLRETLREKFGASVLESDEVEEARFFTKQAGKTVHLPSTLSGLAHFHYFLRRQNRNVLLPGFGLEMHKLRGRFPETEVDFSAGKNGNLIEGPSVQLVSQEKVRYGFTMRNTSNRNLFPYLFYFDPETYQILCWYSPENPNDMPPLRKGGSLTVGIGGENPFAFGLDHNQNVSSGFLKLFVSTEYLDLPRIEQKLSPLNPDFQGVGRLKGMTVNELQKPMWNAVTIFLTMSRK
ncbi:caspase domain-containing protein [Mycena crocata]|nr:caspase domain-containing protein [Mycena crocata]